jgi:hypothetical protein
VQEAFLDSIEERVSAFHTNNLRGLLKNACTKKTPVASLTIRPEFSGTAMIGMTAHTFNSEHLGSLPSHQNSTTILQPSLSLSLSLSLSPESYTIFYYIPASPQVLSI